MLILLLHLLAYTLSSLELAPSRKCLLHLELHHLPLEGSHALQSNFGMLQQDSMQQQACLQVLWHCLLQEWDTHW